MPIANWKYRVSTPQSQIQPEPQLHPREHSTLYNAMIAPLGPMRLAGVAWYQGEADVGKPGYDIRLGQLFLGWRRQFGDQARMLVVQLASAQLSPRIIGVVFRDRVTRFALTLFAFTFTFAFPSTSALLSACPQ